MKDFVLSVLGFYLLALLAAFVFQRHLLYFPSRSYIGLHEARANKKIQEFDVTTEDGLALKGWYAPASDKPYTFVFFHGNGDSLVTASPIADPYIADGYGFLIAEYRGYSGLPGHPSEKGLYADARAYLKKLVQTGINPNAIILLGHSLGTGVATQMAEEFNVGGLVLLAPYLSIVKMAQLRYPFFPAKYMVLDRFDSAKKIARVHAPLLIVNGKRDGVIPAAQGKQLFVLANEPKQYFSFPDLGHNNLFDAFASVCLAWTQRLQRNP